ncbi:hypothetical protein KCH_36810 [Kitasatospora cheerisanensis KCTC 2395]|uniref:Uncharacterized protein n=1 Tax=Kitasatospora cheerisanensis KCTC 2395 TaxID=1348663 RepID=A0A066YX76_9ACTN|nr:hypothetical protein KCH_36810 [Kitasatospora cheerisanensis KCTC 2395]
MTPRGTVPRRCPWVLRRGVTPSGAARHLPTPRDTVRHHCP